MTHKVRDTSLGRLQGTDAKHMLAVGFKDQQLCLDLSEKVDGGPDGQARVANKPQHANEGQATPAALRSGVK